MNESVVVPWAGASWGPKVLVLRVDELLGNPAPLPLADRKPDPPAEPRGRDNLDPIGGAR